MDTGGAVNDTKDVNPATALPDNSSDFLIISPNGEPDKRTQPSHSLRTIRQSGESDDVMAQSNVGPGSGMWPTSIESVSCDASIIDGLMNVSSTLSSSSVLRTSEQSSVCHLEQRGGEEEGSSRKTSKTPLLEEGPGSAGTLSVSACSDVLTADDHSVTGSRVQGLEVSSSEEEGGRGAQGVNTANIAVANDFNKTGVAVERETIANTEIATVCSHESEKTPGESTRQSTPSEPAKPSPDVMPEDGVGSDRGSEGQGTTVLPPYRQDQDGKPECTENTVAFVCETAPNPSFPLETPLLLQVGMNGLDIHTVHTTNQSICAEKATGLSSESPETSETVEKSPGSAGVVNTEGCNTRQRDIRGAVCEPHKLQSSKETAESQSSTVAQTPIKGPDTTQDSKGDKASSDEKEKASQGSENNKRDEINNETEEKQRLVKPTGAADVFASGSAQCLGVRGDAAPPGRIEISAFHDISGVGSVPHIKMPTANDSVIAGDQVIDHSVDASPSVLVATKSPEDFVETPSDVTTSLQNPDKDSVINAPAYTGSSTDQVPGDKGLVTPPHTDLVDNASHPLIKTKTSRELVEISLDSDRGPDLLAGDSTEESTLTVEQVCAGATNVPESQTKMSTSPDRGITTRSEPETDRIKELREVAGLCDRKSASDASESHTLLR